MPGRVLCALAIALAGTAWFPALAQAQFGIEPGSFRVEALNRNGTPDLQAGSHPYALNIEFNFNHDAEGNAEGSARDVVLDLPPGLIGNPSAIGECAYGEFENTQSPLCPGTTQVGTLLAHIGGTSPEGPIYNLTPPPGAPARLGFGAAGLNVLLDASVRTGEGYGIGLTDNLIPLPELLSVSSTTWGVPADPGHDADRQCVGQGKGFNEYIHGCPSGAALKPFLTLPTSCTGPLAATLKADSREAPGVFAEETAFLTDAGGAPAGLTGCGRLPFAPTISAAPEATSAETPTGLQVDLHLPQPESPEGLAEADLKSAVVTLPLGLVVNPSAAAGLAACTSAEIELGGPAPARCPDGSKIGTVEVDTPLLDHPLPGSVYLAAQGDNPFHSLLAIYIAIDDPLSGVVVKLAGHVEPDGQTGQLKTTFADNPQLPFEDLKLDFFGGPRAALTTPATCGEKTTTTDLTPWTAPEGADAFPTSTFKVTSGAGGAPCPASEAAEPDKPSFEAGTVTPLAGVYSPFVLSLRREDGDQQFGSIDTTLPEGLLGRLAGVQECPDAQIAQAEARRNPGEGALEKASPSCPPGSEVGVVDVSAGSGTPLHVQGHAYLAGPYKGAPLSLAILTPAVAGPFDLGVVVVRAALYVNEVSAQIHAVSDPLPHILAGIPLDIRSIEVAVNRPGFTLNPTSCEPKQVTGTATSLLGALAPLTQRFQVGGCAGLAFKPKLSLNLSGQVGRLGFPTLKAVLRQPAGENANIAGTSVILPKGLFIAQAHVNAPCTRVQFASTPVPGEGCPAKSVLGTAKVWTPLLSQPEEGKVYFRSNGGERELPDLVVALRGQIPLQLVGFIDSVGKKHAEVRRVRTRFQSVPDAPVSRFELSLSGGKRGLLENSHNLCRSKDLAKFHLTGQNGKTYDTEPLVGVSCPKRHQKGSGKRK